MLHKEPMHRVNLVGRYKDGFRLNSYVEKFVSIQVDFGFGDVGD
jgi:hypothetical protein